MTNLQDFLFPVKMVKRNEKTVSAQSHKILGFVDGIDNEPTTLNNCSEGFNLLQNIMVYPIIESMLDIAKIEYVKSYKMNKEKTVFHSIYILKSKDGVDLGIDVGGNGDKIYPTLMVGNSYNGFKMSAFLFGYFRMICANGIIIPLEGKEESNLHIKGKHTKKLNLTFETLVSKIDEFIAKNDKVKKKFEVLGDRMVVEFEERVLEVVSATGVSVTQEQFAAINETIANEARVLGGNVNDFLIYNGINGHIYKGVNSKGDKRTSSPEMKRTEDRKVFDYIMAN